MRQDLPAENNGFGNTHEFRVGLRRNLSQYFGLAELRTLCFDIGLDWEDLEGTTKSTKVESLIIAVERIGRLDELLQLAGHLRPNVKWPTKPSNLPAGDTETSNKGVAPILVSRAYHSCFISYSTQDSVFAEKLYGDLREVGIDCWFAPEDLKIGDYFPETLDKAVWKQEKLLLILSRNSVESNWVAQEASTAVDREWMEKKHSSRNILVLFPISLDNAVYDLTIGWAASIRRTRHIGDFRNWQDETEYQRAFARLLRDLRIEK